MSDIVKTVTGAACGTAPIVVKRSAVENVPALKRDEYRPLSKSKATHLAEEHQVHGHGPWRKYGVE